MAKTKTKPGPAPKYGPRKEIHVKLPEEDLEYIRSKTDNVTEWIIDLIKKDRMTHETNKRAERAAE